MASKLYLRDGGTELADVNDISSFAPSFESKTPLIELGMSFQNGGASQGTFVTNPTFIYGTPGGVIAPHAQVTWTEDASGDELWLARGRTSGEEEGRGIAKADDKVEHVVTVDDANVDVRGLAFTEDWVRPAENETDRLYALDAYILSAGSSTSPTFRYSTDITIADAHLAPDTETFFMPAKTYPAGTQPQEVINDCAESASKVWGVVIHHTGGTSHLCLLYIKELDHSTFASTVKISDQVSNWDPEDLTAPVYEPIWDQGKGLVFGAQSAVSGILNRYGQDDQFVYVNNPTLEDENEHWIEAFSDADSETAAQAEARADAILSYRSFGDVTYRTSVVVLPEQIHLLGAGMSLQADTAVFPGGTFRGTYEDVRIVQLTWEPIPDGRYFAHMQLNRTPRTLAPSRGRVQPAATTPTTAPECLPDTVVAPTTIWHATYATDDQDDESSTYSFGLERTLSGGFGDYPPANAFFGANYGRNNAGAYASQKLPWDEADDLAFHMDILWRYTPSNRNVDLLWYDVSNNLLRTDRAISGAGHAVDTGYSDLGTNVTPPAGATQVQISYTNFAGLFGDNIYLDIPGSIIPADNDPYCLVAGPGDSPYYAATDDPRFASMEQQIADLEGATGSSLEWFIVTDPDYGAEGDGTTDDTSAIQAAIDAAEVAGGVVYFPQGTYKVSGLVIAASNVELRGAGASSVIAMSSATGDTVALDNAAIREYVTIRALQFQPSVTRTADAEITAEFFSNLRLLDLTFSGDTAQLNSCIDLGATSRDNVIVFMQNIRAHTFNRFFYGVRLLDLWASNISTDANTAAANSIIIEGGVEGSTWSQCDFVNSANNDASGTGNCLTIRATDYATTPPRFNTYQSCYFDSHQYGLQATAGKDITFVNCWFSARPAAGAYVNNAACENFVFIGCRFENCGSDGLLLNAGTNHQVIGCQAISNDQQAGGADGFAVASVTGLLMSGNRAYNRASFGGTQDYGLSIAAGVAQFIVHNNDFTGNGTGSINNGAGTSTTKIVANNLPDGPGGITALDDLSDVTLTAPAEGDMLRYESGEWVNTPGRWEPVTTNPGAGPELVWDGDEIVMTWSAT